jgi:hypothetical protein
MRANKSDSGGQEERGEEWDGIEARKRSHQKKFVGAKGGVGWSVV